MDPTSIRIPDAILPVDGRFGCGPSKVRPGQVDAIVAGATRLLGTSHRQPGVKALVGSIRAGLGELFGLPDGWEIVLGNGGTTVFWDAATFGLIERRSQHLVFGEFSAKFAEACRAAPHLDPPDRIESAAGDHPLPVAVDGVDLYALTHNETSTGVTNPIAELTAVVREIAPETLILVDGVSGLGAMPFEQDAWGIDLVVSGSQKAWMAAPGMAFVSVSERGWEAAEAARMPRVYLDLRDHRKSAASGQTPWTPAVAVMYQLDVALAMMQAEGRDALFARHAACAAATRAGLAALGFDLLADPRYASDTVTAAWVPDGLDWKAFNADLQRRRLVVAGGQGQLKGRIFRIGHLGHVTLDDIIAAIGVLEEVAILHGREVSPGSGVAAAQRAGLETAAELAAAGTPA